MKQHELASLDYKARPFATVECGSYNKPNNGCDEINLDAKAAYTHALMFILTDNKKHADKSKALMRAWARKYQKNTESNARLVVAWAAPDWATAGELIRHYDPTWSKADIQTFTGMLNKFLPYVKNDKRPDNNWILSRIEAHMAIAIFKDDEKEFDAAVKRWRARLPTYIYMKSDGATPIVPPGRKQNEVKRIWDTNGFVEGQAMETCRDLGHMGALGFMSMMQAAQSVWLQGVDLFKPNAKRITKFMELHGGWMTGSVRVPNAVCGGNVYVTQKDKNNKTNPLRPPKGGGEQTWEIAYNHFGTRLGYKLPYTKQMIAPGRPVEPGRWVGKWDTLMFGDQTFQSTPPAVGNRPPSVRITMPQNGESFAAGEPIYVLADAQDPDTNDKVIRTQIVIDGELGREEVNAPFEWGHDTTPKPGETTLSRGQHTITVTAFDQQGAKGSDSISITIQ